MSNLAVLMLEHWSKVFLSPWRLFLVYAPTIGCPYQNLLWFWTMVWQFQKNPVCRSGKIRQTQGTQTFLSAWLRYWADGLFPLMSVEGRLTIKILVPCRHWMWSEIPRHTSYGTGYCLSLIGVAPGFMSSMMGAWFLAKPGGPFSALTAGNSFSRLVGFVCSLSEE